MTAPSATRRVGSRDGFLLVEALSALALGALILVALLSLTGLLRKSADRAAWGVEVSEVSKRTVDTIARELRQATRRRWAAPPLPAGAQPTTRPAAPGAQQAAAGSSTDAAARAQRMNAQPGQADGPEGAATAPTAPPRPFVFSGAPDRVTFTLSPRQETGLRAAIFVAYQIEDGGAVLRAEAPLTPDAAVAAAIQLGPVARIDPGPERLRFAYVQRQPSGDDVILDAWTDPLKMPFAIRIDRFDARSGEQVGSLRVPLLIDAEPGCVSQKGSCSRVEGGGGAGVTGGGQQNQPAAVDPVTGEPQ